MTAHPNGTWNIKMRIRLLKNDSAEEAQGNSIGVATGPALMTLFMQMNKIVLYLAGVF